METASKAGRLVGEAIVYLQEFQKVLEGERLGKYQKAWLKAKIKDWLELAES